MTTVLVVRKGGTVAIAADTLDLGDAPLAHGDEASEKLFEDGDTWIGMAGAGCGFDRKSTVPLPRPHPQSSMKKV